MHLKSLFRRFGRDKGGLALLEFALALPVVLPLGMYSIELCNFALTQLKISQMSLVLADNASRVGVDTTLATQDLREVDIDDVLQGLRLQAGALNVTTNGRVTLSSLEVNNLGGQYIQWQRCLGLKSGAGYDSSYGVQGTGSSPLDLFFGMGDPPSPVMAPPNSAVMFVEINYDYTPLVSKFFLGNTHMHSIASLIVRDNRNLGKAPSNPDPQAVSMTCDKHTT